MPDPYPDSNNPEPQRWLIRTKARIDISYNRYKKQRGFSSKIIIETSKDKADIKT
jgi:hypothetical protein